MSQPLSSVRIEKVPLCIRTIDMRVGQYGWISNGDIAIVEIPNVLPKRYERVINLKGNVHPVGSAQGSVYIKRVGKDLLGEDFELDFSNCSSTFDIFDVSPFPMSTTSCAIVPDHVTEQTVKMYFLMDDLYDEMRELFDMEQYTVKSKAVQDLLAIMIEKDKNECKKFTLIKLLNKFFDCNKTIESTTDFIKREEEDGDGEYDEDVEYAHAEIQLAHAMKENLIEILKEKIPLDYYQYTEKRQQSILEKINGDPELCESLQDVLLETIEKKPKS